MKRKYLDIKMGAMRLDMIAQVNRIVAEYAAQGFDLTLRQLYYQFVSRDMLANRQSEYKRLGDVVNDARLAGLVDWDAIVDRTRNLHVLPHWESPRAIVAACASQFRLERWSSQPFRVEVWIEKDALVGVIEQVCQEWDVPFFSCRGYTSQSEMWAAAQRMRKRDSEARAYRGVPQPTVVLHFGDHDPSGIDMTRDITDRLQLFGAPFELRRLALTEAQVTEYAPPPNPAKLTDSRFAQYQQQYGDESWELDALEPAVLADLIRRELATLIDVSAWDDIMGKENRHRYDLSRVASRWDEVTEFLHE